MFIPEKSDSADLMDDQQLPTQLSSSITTDLTNLTNLSNLSSSNQPEDQSDKTSRLGDELELSATYILDHQPKLVSRSSSLSFQNLQNHPQPEVQMLQSIQPLQPLVENTSSIDSSSFIESNFIEQKSDNTLLSSFPFNPRLPCSDSFNNAQPYFEQLEHIGLLNQNIQNIQNLQNIQNIQSIQNYQTSTGTQTTNQRCPPTVVLIATGHHEDPSNQSNMYSTQQNLNLYANHLDHLDHNLTNSNYHQETYHHVHNNHLNNRQT